MTTATDRDETRPTIALAMGDPTGISPELTAKLLTLDEVRQAARIVVIGDRRVFDAGADRGRGGEPAHGRSRQPQAGHRGAGLHRPRPPRSGHGRTRRGDPRG